MLFICVCVYPIAISTARGVLQSTHEKEIQKLDSERQTLRRNLSSSDARVKTLDQKSSELEIQVYMHYSETSLSIEDTLGPISIQLSCSIIVSLS